MFELHPLKAKGQVSDNGLSYCITGVQGNTAEITEPFFLYIQEGKIIITTLNPTQHCARSNAAKRILLNGEIEEWLPPQLIGLPVSISGEWFPKEYVEQAKLWEHKEGYEYIGRHFLHYGPTPPDESWHLFNLENYHRKDEVRGILVEKEGETYLTDGQYAVG